MDINALYGFIVTETYSSQLKTANKRDADWARETFRRLVGAIVVLSEPLSLVNLSSLLNLRRNSSPSEAVDVIQLVRRLRIVLVSGTEIITGQTIPRPHKSFVEYVTGDQVDEHFKVDERASHRELGIRCLCQVPQAKSAVTSFKMPTVFRYATRFWSRHLDCADMMAGIMIADPSTGVICNVDDVENLWKRVKLALPPIGLAISDSAVKASVLGQVSAWDINTGIVQGGISLVDIMSKELPKRAPNRRVSKLQSQHLLPAVVGTSTFSNGTHVNWALPHDKIGQWDTKSGNVTLNTTLNRARWSAAAGTTIEAGCFAEARDGVIYVWDVRARSGDAAMVRSINFLKETAVWDTEKPITCLALSPTGETLAVGCDNGTLHFWDITSNPPTRIPAKSADSSPGAAKCSQIQMVVFSADGANVLSWSEDDTAIHMWQLLKNEFRQRQKSQTKQGKGAPLVCSGAFTHDNTAAFVGYKDGSISLQDAGSGEQIGSRMTLDDRHGAISFIYPSTDGVTVISGTDTGRLDIWDVETRKSLVSYATDNASDQGISACVLPNGRELCVAGMSQLRLLAIQGKHCDFKLYDTPKALALSPDGTQVAASFSDGAIHLLNAVTGKLIAKSAEAGAAGPALAYHSGQDLTLFFTPHDHLATVSNGESLEWTVIDDGIFSYNQVQSGQTRLPPVFIDKDHYNHSKAETYYGAHWIPSNQDESGVWAFVGNHIVRGQPDGTLVVTQLEMTQS
ncbi:hypothetical protein DXG01_005359 [Tephrocybe rancida]|nr:hypothetical protein DXG01_005359 [Tephrocybe rancida]